MDTEVQGLRTYTLHVEGSVLPLKDRDFITTILARSADGEFENALVEVTPEQAEKLHDFLRVHEVKPAADGIYVGHSGIWYAVKQGAITESGRWMIPDEILKSQLVSTSSAVHAESPSDVGERDPVCGMTLKPGQEVANVTYQMHTYHFCSPECRDIFLEAPARYVDNVVGGRL